MASACLRHTWFRGTAMTFSLRMDFTSTIPHKERRSERLLNASIEANLNLPAVIVLPRNEEKAGQLLEPLHQTPPAVEVGCLLQAAQPFQTLNSNKFEDSRRF